MRQKVTRRECVSRTASAVAGGLLACSAPTIAAAASRKGPYDYIIVQGHRDIWEFTDRFNLRQKDPLKNHLLPRLLEGGLNVVIAPAGGDNPNHRAYMDRKLEGAMEVLDMFLVECEKTNGKATILKSKSDIPAKPDRNRVQFFLDMEGGSPFQVDPETDLHPDRRLALLRNFFRLGVRGVQLTHNGRNQLADGIGEGKAAGRLSLFGVEVVQEMNRLGMMVGVSHLSAAGIHHVAELTTKPIASTHTNLQRFINTPRQHSDEEVKAIASTGGVIGIRYISNKRTPYPLLVDEIDHIAELVGIEHAAIGWEGHDLGHPAPGVVPGHTGEAPSAGVESQTMYEHWDNLIALMEERGYSDERIGMVLGGNFLRIFKEILPDEG